MIVFYLPHWIDPPLAQRAADFSLADTIFPSVVQAGEVVRFNDFLRTLPKADEQQEVDMDEEEMDDPKQPIV